MAEHLSLVVWLLMLNSRSECSMVNQVEAVSPFMAKPQKSYGVTSCHNQW